MFPDVNWMYEKTPDSYFVYNSILFSYRKRTMNIKRLLLIIICSILSLLCIISGFLIYNEKRIDANEDLNLTEEKIIELSEKAIGGDGEAAYSIASYFLFGKYDAEEAKKWLRIGADNSNIKCQYNYATLLLELNNEQEMKQAIYYLQQAALNGSIKAKQKLEELQISF